jgi:hypothetical protein
LAVILAVFLAELVDPPGCIDKALLSGEEGMAVGADLHIDRLGTGRMGLQRKAAGTLDGGLLLLGMDILFHDTLLFQNDFLRQTRQRCRTAGGFNTGPTGEGSVLPIDWDAANSGSRISREPFPPKPEEGEAQLASGVK